MVNIEIDLGRITYRIDGPDMKSLRDGFMLIQAFHKNYGGRIAKISIPKGAELESDAAKPSSEQDTKLPHWFSRSKPTVNDVIALILYHANRPLTNGEITSLVAKEWKSVHLRNISKHLTTKGKFLQPYITKDSRTKAFVLNGKGRNLVDTQIIPRLMKAAGLI